LRRVAFLTSLGAIPADRPRAALDALRAGRALIIFPEAELRPLGPLGPTAPGAGWLARRSTVPLVTAATRVVLRGHQKPEAYVDITVSPDNTVAAVNDQLASRLDQLDTELAHSDPRLPLPTFTRVLSGRLGWDERITQSMGRRS
jgi:1-acyl-sn-glycerol-3-phosphate acyltransferase